MSGARLLDLAEVCGIAGVQLDFGGPGRGPWLDDGNGLTELRRGASDRGVELLAIAGNVLNDVGLTAPAGTAEAARVRSLVDRMLDAAAASGCPLVFLPSFRRSVIDGPGSFERTVEVLTWASDQASARTLLLANENTLGPAGVQSLVEQVDRHNFRLILDTYNLPLAGVEPTGVVAAAAGHLADQVHVKDGRAGDTTVAVGAGDGAVGSTLDAMVTSGQDVRFLVLENDYRDGDTDRLSADVAWAERWHRSWHARN